MIIEQNGMDYYIHRYYFTIVSKYDEYNGRVSIQEIFDIHAHELTKKNIAKNDFDTDYKLLHVSDFIIWQMSINSYFKKIMHQCRLRVNNKTFFKLNSRLSHILFLLDSIKRSIEKQKTSEIL